MCSFSCLRLPRGLGSGSGCADFVPEGMTCGHSSACRCALCGGYSVFKNQDILYQCLNLQHIFKNQSDEAGPESCAVQLQVSCRRTP